MTGARLTGPAARANDRGLGIRLHDVEAGTALSVEVELDSGERWKVPYVVPPSGVLDLDVDLPVGAPVGAVPTAALVSGGPAAATPRHLKGTIRALGSELACTRTPWLWGITTTDAGDGVWTARNDGQGDAPRVLVLGGFGGWRGEKLPGTGIAALLAGQGWSTTTATLRSPGAHAIDVGRLERLVRSMAREAGAPITLVGLSAGGTAALLLARDLAAEGLVAAVARCSSPGYLASPNGLTTLGTWRWRGHDVQPLAAGLRGLRTLVRRQSELPDLPRQGLDVDRTGGAQRAIHALLFDDAAVARHVIAIPRGLPLLVGIGGADPLAAVRDQRVGLASSPSAIVVEEAEAGHFCGSPGYLGTPYDGPQPHASERARLRWWRALVDLLEAVDVAHGRTEARAPVDQLMARARWTLAADADEAAVDVGLDERAPSPAHRNAVVGLTILGTGDPTVVDLGSMGDAERSVTVRRAGEVLHRASAPARATVALRRHDGSVEVRCGDQVVTSVEVTDLPVRGTLRVGCDGALHALEARLSWGAALDVEPFDLGPGDALVESREGRAATVRRRPVSGPFGVPVC